jgi:transposase
MSNQEVKMTIKTLAQKGVSKRAIARQLRLSDSTVRYHLKRLAADTPDGRSQRPQLAEAVADAISHWLSSGNAVSNTAALHDWLVAEHDYTGSLRSVQRYVARHYPPPRKRTRRRVETPPGAQAQVDWGHFPGVVVGGARVDLSVFDLKLSHSRMPAVIWSTSQKMTAWLDCHNRAFERLGGVPAVLRVDNCKTAVVRGAGPWGRINTTYERYAQMLRFHIDPCLPREPRAKGKVERDIRTLREVMDPTAARWDSLEELQAASDEKVARSLRRRRCPATGTSIQAAFEAEQRFLAPLPVQLPSPFDSVVTRPVGGDCLIAFEGRQYSVPFRYVGERVEVRGADARVEIYHGGEQLASHPRATDARLVIDGRHYEGEPTSTHLPPMPLGRMGRCLEKLGELPVSQRPVDLYEAIAQELAR